MENTIQRGEMYIVNFGESHEGSVQSGLRPGVIIQNNIGNQYSSTTVVIPCSSVSRSNLPVHVLLQQDDMEKGMLLKNSIIQCEQLRVINTYSLGRLIGKVNSQKMNEIEQALLLSLGMPLKPKIKVFT